MSKELLQQALDALDAITDDVDGTGLNTMPSFDKALDAIAALRSALDAPEPEPWREAVLDRLAVLSMDAAQDEPPASILRRIIEAEVAIALDPRVSDAAPAVPLTDEQIDAIASQCWTGPGLAARFNINSFARAIERAHNIGGSNGAV